MKPSCASAATGASSRIGLHSWHCEEQPGGDRDHDRRRSERTARRGALFATGGNGAIYYGLGVTEHSQGSTTVIAIANLAMATAISAVPVSA